MSFGATANAFMFSVTWLTRDAPVIPYGRNVRVFQAPRERKLRNGAAQIACDRTQFFHGGHRLWLKVSHEMRPGALFISNSFEVPDVEATAVIEVNDSRKTRLYCYWL